LFIILFIIIIKFKASPQPPPKRGRAERRSSAFWDKALFIILFIILNSQFSISKVPLRGLREYLAGASEVPFDDFENTSWALRKYLSRTSKMPCGRFGSTS
jgi:hypothetical protein